MHFDYLTQFARGVRNGPPILTLCNLRSPHWAFAFGNRPTSPAIADLEDFPTVLPRLDEPGPFRQFFRGFRRRTCRR